MINSTYYAAATLFALAASASAAVLADFNFNNLTTTPSTVVENLSVTSIDRHDGTVIAFYAYPTNGNDNYMAGYYWTSDDYYEFQVTVPSGGNLSLASISFNGDSNLPSGDFMSTAVEYSSSASFTNPKTMGSFDVLGPFSSTFQSFSASSNPLITGGGTYYFRIYNQSPSIQYATSYGLYLDNIQLNGTLAPTLPGDTNLDGAVDATDLATLMRNSGDKVTGGYADGDLNGDGIVNADDFSLFFHDLALYNSDIIPAPEPGSALMIFGGAMLMLFSQRRRSIKPM